METQLESLTKDQSTVLLYFDGGVNESWWMFRIDEETAKKIQSSENADTSRSQLADSYALLQQSLTDNWRTYLKLPAEATSGNTAPTAASLQPVMVHYDKIATDPAYAKVAALPGFADTHAALKSLASELSTP